MSVAFEKRQGQEELSLGMTQQLRIMWESKMVLQFMKHILLLVDNSTIWIRLRVSHLISAFILRGAKLKSDL